MSRSFVEKIKDLQLNKLLILRSCRSAYAEELLTQLTQGFNRVNLEQLPLRVQAKGDAAALVRSLKLPVYLENLQYAPMLLPQLAKLPLGSVWASCRQSCVLVKQAKAAGVVQFLDLPLAAPRQPEPMEEEAAWQLLWQGQWRGAQGLSYEEYLRELLQADVVEVTSVRDGFKFFDYLLAVAMQAGGAFAYAQLAQAAQLTVPKSKSWLRVLLGTGLCYLLRQGDSDVLYFRDTGLLCHLLGLATPQAARQSGQARQLWQNFLVNQWRERYIQEALLPPENQPDMYNF